MGKRKLPKNYLNGAVEEITKAINNLNNKNMNKNTYLTPKQIRDLEMIKLQDRIKELE